MSRIRLPRCRKFPPRISQEELKSQTTNVMKEKGANNHFQAQFYRETSQEVVGSKDPKFATLQPILKIKDDNEAWQQSYEFVFDFLKKNEMTLTLETMNVEFNLKMQKPLSINLFDELDREQFCEDLLDQTRNTERNFENDVNEFAEKEGI